MVYYNRIRLTSLVFLTELQGSANITDPELGVLGGFFVTKGKRAIQKICEGIPERKLKKPQPNQPTNQQKPQTTPKTLKQKPEQTKPEKPTKTKRAQHSV